MELHRLKRLNYWLTNPVIARALSVTESRVNSWTKYNGPKMDKAFIELLKIKINSGEIKEPKQ
tara:strand:- start:428 stop:616 length:189 start_codon:yes stop_codon:yes gene_type:complete